MRFQYARARDAGVLHARCFPWEPASAFADRFQRILQLQKQGRAVLLVARDDDEVVGSGQLIHYTAQRAEIANLHVVAALRGQGIGTALIQELLAIARRTDPDVVEIGVTAENGRARALYERLGFRAQRTIPLAEGGSATILAYRPGQEG